MWNKELKTPGQTTIFQTFLRKKKSNKLSFFWAANENIGYSLNLADKLRNNNIKVDIIGGTSSGSMIAMLYAAGFSPYHIYTLFKKYSKDIANINTKPLIRNFVFNKRITLKGLKTGNSVEKIFDEVINKIRED